jgi:hypothetical protein
MPGRRGYDPAFGYDRGFQGGARGYDRPFRGGRYDRGFGRGRYDAPYAGLGPDYEPVPFPFVPFGYDPMMGPMAWSVPPAYGPWTGGAGRGPDRGPRVPPRRSPTYGRGGDRALRAWADRYGYDVEYSIPPRPWPRR